MLTENLARSSSSNHWKLGISVALGATVVIFLAGPATVYAQEAPEKNGTVSQQSEQDDDKSQGTARGISLQIRNTGYVSGRSFSSATALTALAASLECI